MHLTSERRKSGASHRYGMVQCIMDGMTRAKERGSKLRVYCADTPVELPNQLCLFLKPGAAETHPGANCEEILELVLTKIGTFKLHIDEVHVLPWQYLQQHRIMNQHYGVLDCLARNAAACMSDQMRRRFREVYGVESSDVDLLGGFEFVERFKDVSPVALDLIWSNVEHQRLASGCFCGRVKVGNEIVFVINGFTPRQLETYADPRVAIAVFVLTGRASWYDLRMYFVGKSNPREAAPGSIRNELFMNRIALGIRDLGIATNGAHLSAGPVEALAELRRFTSDFTSARRRPSTDLQFGRKLACRFTPEQIDSILLNPMIEVDGQKRSVFDLTEEMDEVMAVELLTSVGDQIGSLRWIGSERSSGAVAES